MRFSDLASRAIGHFSRFEVILRQHIVDRS